MGSPSSIATNIFRTFFVNRRKWLPFAILLLVSLVYCQPLLQQLSRSCRGDWDYFQSLYEAQSVSIFGYGQYPLWNPYLCGGMPLFANPQSGFPSITFLLSAMTGVMAGLKLSVWFHTWLGMIGSYLVAGQLRIRGASRYLPPAVFMLCSVWPYRIAEGHMTWLVAAYVPFLLLGFLRGMKNPRWHVLSIAALCAMIYAGGTYIMVYSLLFLGVYAFVCCLGQKSLNPLIAFLATGGLSACLCAPKLLTMAELLSTHPRATTAHQVVGWGDLLGTLIERDSVMAFGSCESAAYVGVATLVLYLAGILVRRQQLPMVMASVFILLVCLGDMGPWSPWHLLHETPFFNNMKIPMRGLMVLVFSVSLIAGGCLSEIESRCNRAGRILVVFGVVVTYLDLMLLGRTILPNTTRPDRVTIYRNGRIETTLPTSYQLKPDETSGLFFSGMSRHRFVQTRVPDLQRFAHGAYSDQFLQIIRNRGVVDAYETIPITTQVHSVQDDVYRGEQYLLKGGRLALLNWTPNRLEFTIDSPDGNRLVINQNYWPGWHTSVGTITNHQGLLALDLPRGNYDLSLRYVPAPFRSGMILFCMGAIMCLALFFLLPRSEGERRRPMSP